MNVIIPFAACRSVDLLNRVIVSIYANYTDVDAVFVVTSQRFKCAGILIDYECDSDQKEYRIITKYIEGMRRIGVDSAVCTCSDVIWSKPISDSFFNVIYTEHRPVNITEHGRFTIDTMRKYKNPHNYAVHMPHVYELKKLEAMSRTTQIENTYYGENPPELVRHERVSQTLFAGTRPDPSAYFYNIPLNQELSCQK